MYVKLHVFQEAVQAKHSLRANVKRMKKGLPLKPFRGLPMKIFLKAGLTPMGTLAALKKMDAVLSVR